MSEYILVIGDQAFPFKYMDLISDDPTLYFTQLFAKELQLIATEYNQGNVDHDKIKIIVEKLLCCQITTYQEDIAPWWSQGYLQHCWFKQDNKTQLLTVNLPSLKVLTLHEWFQSRAVVIYK